MPLARNEEGLHRCKMSDAVLVGLPSCRMKPWQVLQVIDGQ